MSHTPGPWEVTGTDHRSLIIRDNKGTYLFGVGILFNSKDNARLAAAAPDLLEALKYVRDNATKDSVEMWVMIDKAIAKAEGKL